MGVSAVWVYQVVDKMFPLPKTNLQNTKLSIPEVRDLRGPAESVLFQAQSRNRRPLATMQAGRDLESQVHSRIAWTPARELASQQFFKFQIIQ